MVKKINIVQYRKLKDLPLDFCANINLISGANGTCKSSLLHIISNSFQEVVGSTANLSDKNCLRIIKNINSCINPTIESLTKGDKKYNNPAIGLKGTLYDIEYFSGKKLSFRRHNSQKESPNSRYRVIPQYTKGYSEKKPSLPVIYLGLARLFPFGEYQNDSAINSVKQSLPLQYQEKIKSLYEWLTHIHINTVQPQRINDIKNRNEFSSTKDGVDSNTISSGEDDVMIILTALVSLQYYYESLPQGIEHNNVESIMLIDEFDATLHPSLQENLLDVIYNFSLNYRIQFVSTTHSLSLLEYSLRKKHNVIYLIDNIETVLLMDEPDIFKIQMRLNTTTRESIYKDKKIPVFTEDAEARTFLNYFMDYLGEKDKQFSSIRQYLHFVDASLGAEQLKSIFKDSTLQSSMYAFCILDGDKTDVNAENNANKSLSSKKLNNVITLPGGTSPEKLLFTYAQTLYEEDAPFWTDKTVSNEGYDRIYYRDKIKPQLDELEKKQKNKEEYHNFSYRKEIKNLWSELEGFMILVLKYWLREERNQKAINEFVVQLNHMFLKTAQPHGLNKNDWKLGGGKDEK